MIKVLPLLRKETLVLVSREVKPSHVSVFTLALSCLVHVFKNLFAVLVFKIPRHLSLFLVQFNIDYPAILSFHTLYKVMFKTSYSIIRISAVGQQTNMLS